MNIIAYQCCYNNITIGEIFMLWSPWSKINESRPCPSKSCN